MALRRWSLHEIPEDNFSLLEVSDKAALQVPYCLPWHLILSPDGFIFRFCPDVLVFFLPAPCAYADDFAVAAPSFRSLVPALFLAFNRWPES